MSTLPRFSVDKRQIMTVHGFIRRNFVKAYWIEELIVIIVQFYLKNGGSLYVFGSGNYGQLGIEEYWYKNCKKPTICPPFNQNNAWKVAAFYHTLILDTNGCVWSCGSHDYGVLGNRALEKTTVPAKLELTRPVVGICVGYSHSLVLCNNGLVMSFGSNNSGQLGHPNFPKQCIETPKIVQQLRKYKIMQISAGSYFSAALTDEGDLFCFGYNGIGQCGVGQSKGRQIMIPTKVKMDEKIDFIECGCNHSLIITSNHSMYAFGNGTCGCLGNGSNKRQYLPTLIDGLENKMIKSFAAGESHSICIDGEGKVWSFGKNEEGQCALPSYIKEQSTPMMVDWLVNIKARKCFAGNNQSSVLAFDGSLYVFGCNRHYQLALKKARSYFCPQKLSLPRDVCVEEVAMGLNHTAIICSK